MRFKDIGWQLSGKIVDIGKVAALTDDVFLFALFEEVFNDLGLSLDSHKVEKTPDGLLFVGYSQEGHIIFRTYVESRSAFIDIFSQITQEPFNLIKIYRKLYQNFDTTHGSYNIFYRP